MFVLAAGVEVSIGAAGSVEAAAGYVSSTLSSTGATCKSVPDPEVREIGSAELPVPYAWTERFSGFGSGIFS